MDMVRVSSAEFQRALGTHIDQAAREPVTITKHGRDHVVLLSAEEYARLKRRDRQVGLAEEMPHDVMAAFARAKVPDEHAHLNALMADD
jgi:prevent-host-death family protein